MIDTLTVGEASVRLAFALGAGVIVGWERESRGRPAGFRTTILACAAACMSMIISEHLFVMSAPLSTAGGWRPDPARLGAGVLTGIGFLGAGTIIRHGSFVRGVTTAASLWFVTVVGLAFGAGQIRLGCLGTLLALIVLLILPRLERKIASDWFGTLSVTARQDAFSLANVKQELESRGTKLTKMSVSVDTEKQETTVDCELKIKSGQRFEAPQDLVATALKWPGVFRASWR